MNSISGDLGGFRSQAKALTEIGAALNAAFDREEARLNRHDEASRLQTLRQRIVDELQQLREIEASVSRGHSRERLVFSLGELAVTALFSKGNRLSAIAESLVRGPTYRQQPLGLVMACIGPGGLPEDVGAISISGLARESGQPQPEVMGRLREEGYLVFAEESFSLLIDRLAGEVRAGKLNLPVSREKLVEIAALGQPEPSIKISPLE